MSTYKQIAGTTVKAYTTNPSDPQEGEMWYNQTTLKLRGVTATAAWSSAAPLGTARGWMGSAGDKTAGIVFGGSINPYPTFTGLTEEYNGSGWSSGANAPSPLSGIGSAGVGLQTAALSFGANGGAGYTNNSAHYDGSSWTAGGSMNTTGRDRSGAGISTAALGMNSYVPGSQGVTNAEEYDGSTWTAITATGSARYEGMGLGISTSAITCGGRNPPTSNLTASEEWNGSSWTAITNLPQGTHKGQGAGTTTDGCVFGGVGSPYYPATPYLNNKVDYDGSTWAISPATMATSRAYFGGDATTSSGIYAVGGAPIPYSANTEEYNFTAQVVTPAAWASGSAYPATALQLGGSGTQTAGLGFGGTGPGGNPNGLNTTAEYDGAAWTAGGNLNNGKATAARNGVGTQTATMSINLRNDGVATPDFPIPPANHNYRALDNVEEYNGSSWSNGTSTPDGGKIESGTCGTTSAALRFGGAPGNPPAGSGVNSTIYWNDTSWTSLNNMSTARYGLASAFQGAYTAALAFGGYTTTNVTTTEEFDGTNWTSGGGLNTAITRHMGSGTQSAALSFGGPPGITRTEGYDGTTWSTRPNMGTGRHFSGAAGSNTAALCIAGDSSTNVEEFTGETTSANTVDITTAE